MRKRPLFLEEAELGEFDVVAASAHGCLVHACRTRADLRSPYLATHYSPLHAFDGGAANDEVVQRIRLGEVRAGYALWLQRGAKQLSLAAVCSRALQPQVAAHGNGPNVAAR